jgi:hypothetical protein
LHACRGCSPISASVIAAIASNLNLHFLCLRVMQPTQAAIGQEFGSYAWGNA